MVFYLGWLRVPGGHWTSVAVERSRRDAMKATREVAAEIRHCETVVLREGEYPDDDAGNQETGGLFDVMASP